MTWVPACAALVVPMGLSAQLVQGCNDCEISFEEVMILGGVDSGLGYVGRPSDLVQLPDGRIVLSDRYNQELLKIYDAEGTYLRALGRKGKGPGEHESIEELYVRADGGLEVYDLSLHRVTKYSPDFRVLDVVQISIPGVYMAVLSDGSRVLAGPGTRPQSFGLPLHLVDAEGRWVRSFGVDPPIEDLRDYDLIARHIVAASDSSVWSMHRLRYRIEEWSLGGRLLRTLEREVDWFPPVEEAGFISADEPPTTSNWKIHVDDDGLLWVISHVADANWRNSIQERPDPYGRPRQTYDLGNPSTYFDSVIEVIDPQSMKLVAWVRVDEAVMGVIDDGLFYGYRSGTREEPEIPIFRVGRPSGDS